ncbi:hypothetical protein CSV69_03755 [Sporosarcina sp. P26b]|uniref:hypothetical protein n=1 Tax=Sporosarcina sp. P26b TaxID=2048253 RepID=UPI000C16C5BB|nr:hypothetical protein [Sporosarcina sp. P26b]PIC96648.1 hypothetical protein CSV69_03755 [Sporosarcina sp. P26b]
MDDFMNNSSSPADSFDNDFSTSSHFDGNVFKEPIDVSEAYIAHHPIDGKTVYLTYQDPLNHTHKVEFQPFEMKSSLNFVEPHSVKGYHRADGTPVNGYYRDGDGDTSVDRDVDQGGGYFRNDSIDF